MAETFEIEEMKEKVVLVGVSEQDGDDAEDSVAELAELVKTAGAEVVGTLIQKRALIHPGTYVGTGKVQEIAELAEQTGATGIVCDDELSPAQLKNLEMMLNTKVMDRTLIILDIFAARAITSEGKIQVELAQLKYRLSRLAGMGRSMSRLGGGIGTRGPGEKKLEMDRRLIKDRIAQLNRELKEIRQHREITRAQREKNKIPVAAIVGYTNAGTVEFLLDKNNNFYFIEINTRIQVEHGVTELVTGLDLIKEQIKMASGEKLNYTQSDIKLRGHAMEVRINAENPERNFAPCPGTIKTLHIPGGNGVRIDTAVYTGYSIPPYYDSMILKVMAYDTDREQVINKLKSVLGEIIIEGIDTNLDFQYDILNNKNFAGGKITTDFIKDNYGY